MSQLSGPHALVVDDDAMVRFVLTGALEDAGFVVTDAADAAEALDALGVMTSVDLLVTDVRMPGTDGWTLAERAREMRPELPILYVTGWSGSDPHPVERSEMLTKPFQPAQLVSVARRLIAGQASGTAPRE